MKIKEHFFLESASHKNTTFLPSYLATVLVEVLVNSLLVPLWLYSRHQWTMMINQMKLNPNINKKTCALRFKSWFPWKWRIPEKILKGSYVCLQLSDLFRAISMEFSCQDTSCFLKDFFVPLLNSLCDFWIWFFFSDCFLFVSDCSC